MGKAGRSLMNLVSSDLSSTSQEAVSRGAAFGNAAVQHEKNLLPAITGS
jgi:hypothetical protein